MKALAGVFQAGVERLEKGHGRGGQSVAQTVVRQLDVAAQAPALQDRGHEENGEVLELIPERLTGLRADLAEGGVASEEEQVGTQAVIAPAVRLRPLSLTLRIAEISEVVPIVDTP